MSSLDPWDTIFKCQVKVLNRAEKKGEKINREKIIVLCIVHNYGVKQKYFTLII